MDWGALHPGGHHVTALLLVFTVRCSVVAASSKKRPLEPGAPWEEGDDAGDDGDVDASGKRKSPRPRHLVLARQHSSTSNSSEEGADKDADRYVRMRGQLTTHLSCPVCACVFWVCGMMIYFPLRFAPWKI